ncbi:hypothetical protein [Paractinoplanes hotanensis]|uniref:Uncharacterized protein n=1 Tax=Paractinoplanes hotanensis TaxID=2906497 RepID=A0ABT0XY58_9ACTN|nr:hypothetical protein [Actinoplanes hotanensis]MCM4078727.1 hypothetical protein [Actinoplanes hotanensis]
MTADLPEIRPIYAEPAAAALPRFPGAEVVEVESDQRIDELYGGRRWSWG